jgi:cytochrome b involved in lipid metabolism
MPFDVTQFAKSHVGNEITHQLKKDAKSYADAENSAMDIKLQYFHKDQIVHYVQNPTLAAGAVQHIEKLVF